MGSVSRGTKTIGGTGTAFETSKTIDAGEVNYDFDTLYTLVAANIDDANIKAAAAIDPTKIDDYQADAGELDDHNDPAGAAPVNLAEEIAELRYTIRQIKSGTTNKWYTDPEITLHGGFRGYIDGFQMSADGTTPDLTIGAGSAKDSTELAWLVGSAYTKQTDATWAAGTAAGGYPDSIAAIAASTWYNVFAIGIPSGAVDYGFDLITNLDASGLLADSVVAAAGYTLYRRIGAVLMDGTPTNILGFTQWGDRFYWLDPPNDVTDASVATTQETPVISVPTGIQVMAIISAQPDATGQEMIYIQSPSISDEAPSSTVGPGYTVVGGKSALDYGAPNNLEVLTDTSGQIAYRASGAGEALEITTLGWIDQRGKNA